MHLTERQEGLLNLIQRLQAERGVPPSTRECQEHLGYRSQTSVVHLLRVLVRNGLVKKLPDGRWGLPAAELPGVVRLPVFGSIPASLAAMREQPSAETVAVDPNTFGVDRSRGQDLWALRVRGDSMVDAHILNGDLAILVRREPQLGDFVAATIEGGPSMLRRLVKATDPTVLRAGNRRDPDLLFHGPWESHGVLVGVIRRAVA